MLPTAGLFLPETLHRAEFPTTAHIGTAGTKLKYFQRKHVRPKQERTESEARSSITAQDETRTEAPTDFPAISTAYSFADHVLYSEKSSPDLLTFANIIRLVRIDTEEANRLYLSSVVSNFLDSFPTKRIWIEGSLQEVQRALNDIGKDMDVAWGQEGDPSTVSFKRKIDWGLKNQKKLLKKQQQLSVCHSQLTGAIYVMQTAELCGKPGTIAQDPIFEAPARPWVPHNEMNAQRGPYSRHKYRTSQANLSALNIKLSSEAQWNDAETASVNSLPVELAGSTPDDLNLTGRHNSQDFLSPQVSRELVSESPSLLRRPRARSDYFPSTANRERLSGASIDVIPSSTTVDDTTLERSDSTLSAQATVSTPMLARRYRATSVHIQRPTEKHRSLPSKLPHLKSQPSLIDDLVGYVVPNKEIVQIPDREWTASPSSSVPSISLTSSPIIGHTLSAVPEMTILNDESSAVTPISDVEGHTIQLSQAEDPSRDKGDHPTQLQDPNVATSPIETQDDFVSRRRSSDVPQRSTSSLSYYSLSTDTPRSPSSFTNFTLPDHEPVRRPSSQRPSQRMAKRRPHISSSRSLVSAPSLTIATIVEPTTTISNTEEGANQEATPSLAPETTTTINMNGFSQSIFVQTTNTSEELDDDDMVLSVLQERLRCQLQVKTMAENLVRAADAETPSSPTPAITDFNRAYDRQRALCKDATLIKRWFKLVEKTKAKLGICDEDVYNFDEAGFIMGKITTQLYYLSAWYEEDILRDWAIAVSDNGWTNNELGVEWLKHFNAHTQARSSFTSSPLNVGYFSPLKRAYSREVESLMRNYINHITKLEFLPAFKIAFDRAFTPANICSAFRGAGLVPLQLEAVLSKLDVQLRTPTPPAPALLEAPWITSLERANSAASARRRRSKRRIQKHGVLTKGAGEDILAQNEADQQIAHEERQGGARLGLSQRAQRRCTRCKETGHNSRTCKTNTINIE
ncbi:hypothetical protein PtrM4_127810 [Pyrenophora tritici-repentis]|uniref:CCHC-type domain-containing protein n=1 Tax=Pyrenophora tritici-repentis TaxID=45151 RepID=A0A834RQB0_9PLEO|nr:hypothetical protein PtrM4_127810 [Pyrenophora tritici-repentis]